MKIINITSKKKRPFLQSGDPGSMLMVLYIMAIVFFLLLGCFSRASATENILSGEKVNINEVKQGELLIKQGEKELFSKAPLLSQQVDIAVSGMVASARVHQCYSNDSDTWLEAVYVFPLPDQSAVTEMRMIIGDRVVVGKIQEKQQAKRTYLKAKQEGKKTSLLAQKRPNIFTMAVANIPPKSSIEVEIEYLDAVHFDNNTFSYRFPMVVGPRYIPGTPLDGGERRIAFDKGGWALDSDQVEDASEITPPVAAPGEGQHNPVELSLTLAPGFPMQNLKSLYHGINMEEQPAGTYRITFNGKVYADRDFVIEYQAANAQEVSASYFSESTESGDYGYLMLSPPVVRAEKSIPRELLFVLDISGSMAGSSIRQAKSAMQYAVSRLHAQDLFNIIVFNNTAHRLFARPLDASEENRRRALTALSRLEASGGTEIASALSLALEGDEQKSFRQIVFLTDGAVGNERALFRQISEHLGDARLFTIGIGSAPNTFFMTRAAAMGRGSATTIGKIEEVAEKMTGLFEKLEHPVVTDLKLELQDGGKLEYYPNPLPDLYMGEPVNVFIKSAQSAALQLSGAVLGQRWSVAIDGTTGKSSPNIAKLWARKKIRSLMDMLQLGAAEAEVRRQVTETALEHQLVSRYTSLVAVEEKRSRPSEEYMKTQQMKTNLPHGWQYGKVFGAATKTATRSDLMIRLGMVILMLGSMMLYGARRRKI